MRRIALTIDATASDEQLALAAERLSHRDGVVVLDGRVALRSTSRSLVCEVIDPWPSTHRCAEEYAVMVENARRALEASRLGAVLPDLPREWRVVEVRGTDTTEMWRAT